jgi:hypothetical protein
LPIISAAGYDRFAAAVRFTDLVANAGGLEESDSGIVNLGIMLVVMLLVTKLMPSFTPEKEKAKKLKLAEPEKLEGAAA